MDCKQSKKIVEDLLLAGSDSDSHPELTAHLAQCPVCLAQWQGTRRTMALLDEWQAPEPSPYFGTRLRARMEEIRREEAAGGSGFHWRFSRLRTALAAAALCLALAAGIFVEQQQGPSGKVNSVTAPKGTAVNDLQMLDKNQDVYSSFDLLDDIGSASAQQNTDNKSL